MIPMVPKPLKYIVAVAIVLAMIPPALIVRARAVSSEQPRIHFVQDMDNQRRIKAQQASPTYAGVPLFNDGRGMRPVVAGTVARGELGDDVHLDRGVVGGGWAADFPASVPVDLALVERGRERFDIYCAPCHGQAGYGDGPVHLRTEQLLNMPTMNNGTTWVPPKSLHEEAIVAQPIGQIYNTITNGVRNMAGYAAQIPVADRWAIVAYVKALQRSQRAERGDVPDADALNEIVTDEAGES